ncbi:hypothetical protein [Cupriavidus lacunae]|uniref:hypothetical protein n=1 Tax=Cupriavidus lacunae TaxID=2666307 RepID=UPI00142D5788|nr:hypothetical protein [Cupriavidus lacunae]
MTPQQRPVGSRTCLPFAMASCPLTALSSGLPTVLSTGSRAFYANSTNCLIDLQAGIIVDVEDADQLNERGELDQDDD